MSVTSVRAYFLVLSLFFRMVWLGIEKRDVDALECRQRASGRLFLHLHKTNGATYTAAGERGRRRGRVARKSVRSSPFEQARESLLVGEGK